MAQFVRLTLNTGKKKQPTQEYRVRFDINALGDLEATAGLGMGELLARKMNFSMVRLMLCFGLQWERQGLTLPMAGAIIQAHIENGGALDEVSDAIGKAIVASGLFAQADDADDDAEGDANPPQEANGSETPGASDSVTT